MSRLVNVLVKVRPFPYSTHLYALQINNSRDASKWTLSLVIILIAAEDAVEARKRLDQAATTGLDLDLGLASALMDAYESGDDGALENALASREIQYLDSEVAKLVKSIRPPANAADAKVEEEGFC